MNKLLRDFKNKFLNKRNFIFLFFITLMFFLAFLIIKRPFMYEVINYPVTYINYYVERYLGGIFNNLLISSTFSLFVENDVINILSAPFLYCITQQGIIFNILIVILPFILYYIIHSSLYDEVHNGFLKLKILKLGLKKYKIHTFFSMTLFGGLFCSIPKIIYYLFLSLAFENGFSHLHVISNASFVNNLMFEVFQNHNPIILVASDIFLSFIYGTLISIISIIIIFWSRKKINSYIIFTLLLIGQTVLVTFLYNLIGLKIFSLFSYFSIYQILIFDPKISIIAIISPLLIAICIALITSSKLLNKKIEDYI